MVTSQRCCLWPHWLCRCGEWAQAFLLLLRAAGFSARHITDSADHVWCEYYSEALGRWVHVDACEQAWDTPLLYEGGWWVSWLLVMPHMACCWLLTTTNNMLWFCTALAR